MKSFETSAVINATPQAVWDVLTNGGDWVNWNPTIEKIDGVIAAGNTLKVYTKVSPGRAFPVRVSAFSPPRSMVWSGGMPLGLFKGVRTYTVSPVAEGVHFTMSEVFSGLMAPMITKSIPDLQPSFNDFAAALKSRCERGA